MQNFVKTFGPICDFDFLDGPWKSREKPIKFFVKKGIQPPFNAWSHLKHEPYRTLEDGKTELAITKAIENYEGMNESLSLIFEKLNKDGPFDGLAGFSQGFFLV